MPHTASHPSFSWRATAVTAASRNQSIANRSNSSVNFEPGVAHGTALCTTPWVGHSTRGTRVESGLELARVEMPPLPLPMIVDRARGLAFGTRRRRALGAGQPNVHGPARDIQLDPLHPPRGLHSQDRRVQLPVPHRPTSSASSAAGTIAGGVSDGHVTHTRSGRAFGKINVPARTRRPFAERRAGFASIP